MVSILFPFVVAIAISEGIKYQANISVEKGADIYVTRDNYGSNAPIPLSYIEEFKQMEGVVRVEPRVVGRTYLSTQLSVIVGILPKNMPAEMNFMEGRPFQKRGEVIIGKSLSKEFDLKTGVMFSLYLNPHITFKVVGIFDSTPGMWASNLILMSFEDASDFFKLQGMATDILIYTRPGYSTPLAERMQDTIGRATEGGTDPPLRIQDKELVRRYMLRGFNHKAGVFTALYAVAFAIAIPAILVTSGFGLSERKREIGIMKTTGWQTQEVLEMVAMENLIISLIAAPIAILFAFIWLKLFNGAFISQFFIAEISLLPRFSVPSRFLPLPCILSFFFAVVLTMVGSIYSTWRTAIVSPSEAMK